MRSKTQEQWVAEAKLAHPNKNYDYSDVVYTTAHCKVTIICPDHGPFIQTASNHIGKHGCRLCQAESNSKRRRGDTSKFVKDAKVRHGDKYDYRDSMFTGRHEEIVIICREHGPFRQSAGNHLQGNGCPSCWDDRRGETRADTSDEWVTKAIEKHGTQYNYSETKYMRSDVPVTIICGVHGKFEQIPRNHLFGQGCPACSKLASDLNKRDTNKAFVEKARYEHGDKYNYNCVVYVSSSEKVEIICPIDGHGSFLQQPASHLQGNGCPKCGIKTVSDSKYKSTDEWIAKADAKHKGRYDYSESEYIGAKHLITVICRQHGRFSQLADNHVQGRGCPICLQSYGEDAVASYLMARGLTFAREVSLPGCRDILPLRFDFVVQFGGRQFAIEFHGKQHFEPVRFSATMTEGVAKAKLVSSQRRDQIKRSYCLGQGIPLLEIVYYDERAISDQIDCFLDLGIPFPH